MKLAVIGAGGRMGAAIIRHASAHPEKFSIAAALETAENPLVGKDSGIFSGIAKNGVIISSDFDEIAKADVALDFTFHTAVPANIGAAVKHNVSYVLGTTGLEDSEKEIVLEAAKKIPVVWSSNMSLGINILMDLVKRAASVLGAGYDAEIVEMHHRHKKDAPSGTAIMLGEALASGRGQKLADVSRNGREGITGERPSGEIAFHALRGGDVVGDHTVIFADDGERIELSHKASSRDCLAKGAIQAAAWLEGKGPGLYSMTDVLSLG